MLTPGSLVFHKTPGPVDLRDFSNWWDWKPRAYWRHPEGKGSSVAKRLDHPVVHVAFEDAKAYALGGQGLADGGRVGVRRARRIGRRRIRLG
jgi:sulfatase modifying factor 1